MTTVRDAQKTYTADHELATLLEAAAQAGERLRVRTGDTTYELQIKAVATPRDLWEDYDPERIRTAVHRSVALGSSTEPAEVDSLIAEIRAQRDQTPRHPQS